MVQTGSKIRPGQTCRNMVNLVVSRLFCSFSKFVSSALTIGALTSQGVMRLDILLINMPIETENSSVFSSKREVGTQNKDEEEEQGGEKGGNRTSGYGAWNEEWTPSGGRWTVGE